MADGWRNRLMAPVYALVVSFVLVFILGVVLNDPTRIQFTIAGQNASSELPQEFRDFKVRVDTGDGKRTLDDKPLGRAPEFTLLIPDKYIRICTTPPNGWVGANAVPGANGEYCWNRDERGEDVAITLHRQVS